MSSAQTIFPFHLDDEPCDWFDDRHCHARLTASPLTYLDALQDDLGRIADARLTAEFPPKLVFRDALADGGARRNRAGISG